MGAPYHNVIRLRPVELYDPQIRLFPGDPVFGRCVANAYLNRSPLGRRLRVGDLIHDLVGRRGSDLVDETHGIPTLVDSLLFVVQHVRVKVADADFPRFVLAVEGIMGILFHFAQHKPSPLGTLDDTVVQNQVF